MKFINLKDITIIDVIIIKLIALIIVSIDCLKVILGNSCKFYLNIRIILSVL